MTERQRHLVFAAVLGLVLITAGWRVLSLGMADYYARSEPLRALGWRAAHPVALLTAAERSASGGQASVQTANLARAALRANPLEGRAYRILGQLAESAGEQSRAVELYEIAARRSPRDLQTHIWLEHHYLNQGEITAALRHSDLLLRVEPQLSEQQFPILAALAALPPTQEALAQLLSRNPPWREGFVTYLSGESRDSVAIAPFMARLREERGGLSKAELSSWLERLGKDRRWGEAYLTWVSALPSEQQGQLGNVFNGGFEREQSDSGFDWRFGHVRGAYIERLPTPGAGGELALLVGFEDRRVPFDHVRQLLALSPGNYRLELRARADGLRSERGMVWSVTCADAGDQLGSTEPVKGHSPWGTLSFEFAVPEDKCGGQWLRLNVPARIPAEQRIGGRAWFDDLRIVRQREKSAPPLAPVR